MQQLCQRVEQKDGSTYYHQAWEAFERPYSENQNLSTTQARLTSPASPKVAANLSIRLVTAGTHLDSIFAKTAACAAQSVHHSPHKLQLLNVALVPERGALHPSKTNDYRVLDGRYLSIAWINDRHR